MSINISALFLHFSTFRFCRRERIIRTRFKDACFAQYFGKNPYNIRILSRILTSSCAKSAIFKIRRTLKPEFLDDFGAWRSPPSAYLARVISAQSAKNSRFRAGSDSSLSPNQIKNGRSIVIKNSVSVVSLCDFKEIKVENLRFSRFYRSFLFYFRFLPPTYLYTPLGRRTKISALNPFAPLVCSH